MRVGDLMSANNDTNRLGNNIRALREAHGETQEQLAIAIGTSRTNIIHYEKDGYSDISIIKSIAKYYMVSVQELLYSDLSGYNLHISTEKINSSIHAICFQYPIIETDVALSDASFAEAYSYHKALYNIFMKMNIQDLNSNLKNAEKSINNSYYEFYETIDKCPYYLDCYSKAYKNDKAKIESAVNFIALYHIISWYKLASIEILDKPAIFNIFGQLMPNMDEKLEIIKQMPEKELYNLLSQLSDVYSYNNQNHKSLLNDMMITIHKTQEYFDLEQYYTALEYLNNIVDNDSDRATNRRTAYNMLKQFAKRQNFYAERFLKFNPDPLDK